MSGQAESHAQHVAGEKGKCRGNATGSQRAESGSERAAPRYLPFASPIVKNIAPASVALSVN